MAFMHDRLGTLLANKERTSRAGLLRAAEITTIFDVGAQDSRFLRQLRSHKFRGHVFAFEDHESGSGDLREWAKDDGHCEVVENWTTVDNEFRELGLLHSDRLLVRSFSLGVGDLQATADELLEDERVRCLEMHVPSDGASTALAETVAIAAGLGFRVWAVFAGPLHNSRPSAHNIQLIRE